MLRSRAVSRIQQILGFRQDLEQESIEVLQEAQEDLENGVLGLLPWFLQSTAEYVVPANESQLFLPGQESPRIYSVYIREYDWDVSALWSNRGPLKRYEYLPPGVTVDISYEGGNSIRYAGAYWVDGQMIKMDRPLSQESEIAVEYRYYGRDEVLDTDIENKWLREASQLVIGMAGLKLSGVRDSEARRRFEEMQATGADAIRRQDTAYRTGSQKFQMAGDLRKGAYLPRRYFNDTDRGFQ